MASSDGYFARPNHRYLHISDYHIQEESLSITNDSDSVFEFNESDIYNSVCAHHNKVFNYNKSSSVSGVGGVGTTLVSVPMNIPDWSMILGKEYSEWQQKSWRNSNKMEKYYEEEEEGDWDCCVPPHEFLARKREASLSVHEGLGRTLKGRDLSSVRNAIWAKTGFSD